MTKKTIKFSHLSRWNQQVFGIFTEKIKKTKTIIQLMIAIEFSVSELID